MLSTINLLIAFLWLSSVLVDASEFCHIWQLKEYRWDRFRDFLTTQKGRVYWFRYSLFWRSVIALIVFLWPINEILKIKYLLIIIFGLDLIYNAYRYFKKRVRRPILTKKAILIIGLTPLIEGVLFILTRDWTVLFLLMIARFLLVSLIVFILKLPTQWLKNYYVKEATYKLSQYKKLKVIGITGSYGKTTTKTLLTHILSGKFKVLSTPQNINTEIGVAKFILANNFNDVDIFIVEMGAYRIGEIKLICNMVKPTVGILTAINEQHVSLFGDIKKTQQAKYELLRSIPKKGLIITNIDNQYCCEYLGELASQVKTFGLEEEKNPDCLIKEMEVADGGIKAVYLIEKEEWQIWAPVVGIHNTINLAPCLLAALYFDMRKEQIIQQCRTVTLPENVLHIYQYGKCIILDDTYNSNPNGFLSALEIMKQFPPDKKRIVVTRGMLELGEKSDELHERIGEEIAFTADELIIITKDFIEPLRRGVGEKYRTNIVLKCDSEKILDYIKSLKNSDCIILLENRIPAIVQEELKKNRKQS